MQNIDVRDVVPTVNVYSLEQADRHPGPQEEHVIRTAQQRDEESRT